MVKAMWDAKGAVWFAARRENVPGLVTEAVSLDATRGQRSGAEPGTEKRAGFQNRTGSI
jgi:hypothetical protein